MRTLLLLPLLILLVACGDRGEQSVFVADGAAIGGWDPVSYHDGTGPKLGSPTVTTQWRGATWRFANEDHRATFIADPERWAPAYGGWCAWALADSGDLVAVDPQSYLIQDGRLLLFYHGRWGDTRSWWQDGDAQDLEHAADTAWGARGAGD